MRSMKRMTIATAAFGVVVAGTLTGLALTGGTAKAGGISSCSGSGSPVSCAISGAVITQPVTIELNAESSPSGLPVELKWSTSCTLNGTTTGNSGDDKLTTPAWDALAMNVTDPDQCTVTATATLTGTTSSSTGPTLTLNLDSNQNTPSASPSTSTSSAGSTGSTAHQSHGFDGTCLDDKGNSSSLRATVQIWRCNPADKAQNWSYTHSELRHGNLCLNAKGNGKRGSKLILWSCTGSANEIWIHRSNGEMVEKANGYQLCINDPRYSTKNGTQLIVYACQNTPNEHWSVP
jgi:Ricin-type beta-trefoil lectin domain